MSRQDIRIPGFKADNHKSAKNICKNKGFTFNDFIRPKIFKIIEDADYRLKLPTTTTSKKEIKLDKVIGLDKYNELKNICDNTGVSISAYLKIKITEELLKYPSYLKELMK
jgi:hypothetical protein